MLIESLVALVVLANVTVPVVPDPAYLQKLYPTYDQNGLLQAAAVVQPGSSTQTSGTDIAGLISLAVTGGLGYFLQKQKTSTDRRTYMAADTSLKLAQNDQASDAKTLKVTYAMSCMADIMGKYHREDMETYQTIDGVSLWTYIENLNISNNEDFQAKYVNKPQVNTTGTQSKDKVVSTFNQVQQMVTPTPATVEAASLNTTKTVQRVVINKEKATEEEKKTD